jgi:hypothetical protein
LAARVPSHFLPEFAARPIARIRELHVYGNLRMVNPQTAGSVPHCIFNIIIIINTLRPVN